jgi:hypothetical protein
MMYSFILKLSLLGLLFSRPTLSLPSRLNEQLNARDTSLPLAVNVVHQFPKPTWAENLALRSDSGNDILCTILTTPDLFLVDPSTGYATLLHSFPSVLGLLGIAEIGHDIFYVAGGNFSLTTFVSTTGSYAVWEVDIRGYDKHGVAGVKVQKLVDIKEAMFLNGATRLDSASKKLLIADPFLGGVWEVDVDKGTYELGIDIPEMKPTSGPGVSLGVNGIKVKDGYLYFDNTSQGTLSRIAIDKVSGAVSGAVEVLASGIQPDDFVLGDGGLIWIAQNSRNTISVLLKNGTVVNVAGSANSLLVPGPSACEFGKEDKLYCSSTGGLISQVNGTFVGGEILEINTKGFELCE